MCFTWNEVEGLNDIVCAIFTVNENLSELDKIIMEDIENKCIHLESLLAKR